MRYIILFLFLFVGISVSAQNTMLITQNNGADSLLISSEEVRIVYDYRVGFPTGSTIITSDPSLRYEVDQTLAEIYQNSVCELIPITDRSTGSQLMFSKRYLSRIGKDRRGRTFVLMKDFTRVEKERFNPTEDFATLLNTITNCPYGGGGTTTGTTSVFTNNNDGTYTHNDGAATNFVIDIRPSADLNNSLLLGSDNRLFFQENRDTVQTLTYIGDVLTINDGGIDKQVTIPVDTSTLVLGVDSTFIHTAGGVVTTIQMPVDTVNTLTYVGSTLTINDGGLDNQVDILVDTSTLVLGVDSTFIHTAGGVVTTIQMPVDTVQTFTYANDTLTINDGGIDNKLEIIASSDTILNVECYFDGTDIQNVFTMSSGFVYSVQDKSTTIVGQGGGIPTTWTPCVDEGFWVTEAATTKQVGDLLDVNLGFADTLNLGENAAAFVVAEIAPDGNSYLVEDDYTLAGLTRNGQTLNANTHYCLSISNTLIPCENVVDQTLQQSILKTGADFQVYDISDYVFIKNPGGNTASGIFDPGNENTAAQVQNVTLNNNLDFNVDNVLQGLVVSPSTANTSDNFFFHQLSGIGWNHNIQDNVNDASIINQGIKADGSSTGTWQIGVGNGAGANLTRINGTNTTLETDFVGVQGYIGQLMADGVTPDHNYDGRMSGLFWDGDLTDTTTLNTLATTNTITGEKAGWFAYQSTDNKYYYHNGTAWGELGGISGSPFYNTGTTDFTIDHTTNAFRTGHIAIGSDLAPLQTNTRLSVDGSAVISNSTAGENALYVEGSTITNAQIGIRNNVATSGSSIGLLNSELSVFNLENAGITFNANSGNRMRIGPDGQLRLHNYNNVNSYTGTQVGGLGFDATGNVISIAIPTEKTYKTFVSSTQNLTASSFTSEEFTVPSYLNGYTLTNVYYAVNTASDQAFNMNVSVNLAAGGSVNLGSQLMAASATTATQTTLAQAMNTGDVLRIFVNTIAGSMPSGLEIVFEFVAP